MGSDKSRQGIENQNHFDVELCITRNNTGYQFWEVQLSLLFTTDVIMSYVYHELKRTELLKIIRQGIP